MEYEEFIYNGGDVPGYVAWFVYDIATGTWENDCYTIQLDWRICYANAYPDGKGGFMFIEQRDATVAALRELLGVDFRVQSGYLWDALVLIHIPDIHKEEFTMKDIYVPEYSTTEERVVHCSAKHYAAGSSLLDSEGNLHIIYARFFGTKGDYYYTVFDKNLNRVHESVLKLTSNKKSYATAMAEGPDGSVYILAVNTQGSIKGTQLEIWKVGDDLKTLTKVCAPQEVTIKGAEGDEAMLPHNNIIVGNIRNGSDSDGYVPVVLNVPDGKGTYDYYYFSVKLPG